jgi:hypothetical protein
MSKTDFCSVDCLNVWQKDEQERKEFQEKRLKNMSDRELMEELYRKLNA